MKAGWYEKNGSARDVLVVGEMPTPEPGPGEVRVRIHVSGVNPSDVKSRMRRPLAAPRIVPHSDGAGVIDAVGTGVPAGRIGERVWIWNGQWNRPLGTAAEYIVLPEGQAVKLADSIDFAAGACFGIPALTAVHAVNLAGPLAGKSVLVIGGAAAVGHYVTQIAVARGARVITTASPERAEHAKSAGAAEIIDYKSTDVAERVKELTGGNGADIVIDMDLSTTAKLIAQGALASHGTHVCYGSNVAGDNAIFFPTLIGRCITMKFFIVYELNADERRAAIADLDALIAAGALTHTIGARFSLDDIAAAHEAVEGGRVIGNVVVDLR